jgi:hypothetical protein
MSTAETIEQITQAWPGWHVWITRERKSIVATRTGPQQPVDDGMWARTLIADDWTELEAQLAEQAANDAARVYRWA